MIYQKYIKRLLDITMSSVAVVITSPFLGVIALIIKITSKGPVLFKQQRYGRHQKPFVCLPAKYGGFETFVEKLTELKQDQTIKYHVSCMNNDEKHFKYNMADCFNVKVPFSGPAGRVLHVARALDQTYQQIVSENMTDTVVYIL